jgi:hypothetical protein
LIYSCFFIFCMNLLRAKGMSKLEENLTLKKKTGDTTRNVYIA